MFFQSTGSSSVVNESGEMNKVLGKFGHECYGFRRLVSPNVVSRISASLLSTSNTSYASQQLLRQPVPPLDKTLEKYLKSIKPLLSSDELKKTASLAQDFESGIGAKLQELLQKRAQNTDSWLADWWLHSAYLDYRSPVTIFSNPGLVFPLRKFTSQGEQLAYTAKIVLACMDYKLLIDNDGIPQEKAGNDLLDMQQYKKVFGTCRIPGIKRDTLSYNNSDFIVVFHNGHIFKLNLYGGDQVLLNEQQIVDQLKKIISASSTLCPHPVGILSSEHRDTWGKIYGELIKNDTNKASLEALERSLFVICLDKGVGGVDKEHSQRQTIAAGQTIHGGGSNLNTGNRWFDKTVQFLIGEDGINGLTYEHSPAEGQPIAILTDRIMNFIDDNKTAGKESSSVKNIEKLEFVLTPEIESAIDQAKKNIDKLIGNLQLNCFTFGTYGKDFIKTQKLSPDSYFQMAMQYAFYRLHNTPAAHYESASNRKFLGGRTETIRSCSEESIHFAKTMLDSKATVQQKIEALKGAIKSHKDFSVMAVNGLGVDRHLLGLKLIAIENGIDIHPLYSDIGFVKSTHMRISSSQVASKCDGFMCYAPLVDNGYATCYNPRTKTINIATSAFASCSETDVNKYRKAIEDSLEDMHNILMQGSKSKL